MKKGKSQIGINLGDWQRLHMDVSRICQLEFAIVLKPKDNTENSSGEMQRLQMNPP